MIPLLLAHYPSSPGTWQWSEAIFAALTEAGFDGPQRVIGLRCLIAYIIDALLNEFFTSLTGDGGHGPGNLFPADYPHVIDTSRHCLHSHARAGLSSFRCNLFWLLVSCGR